ncbi:MAG TPA: 2-dehydropantoate 2-reductase [Usitatibacter sp.]|nr:2-dehydropantoate 2-reductase [Usitatibacter sp.]
MRICIVGAGAVGGLIGAKLAASGAQVSALARGATLHSLRTHGWRLREGGAMVTAPATAASDPAELGPHDAVIVAVKGPALAQVAPLIAPLLGPATIVVPAMNGVPWWFAKGVAAVGDAPLESVDPAGAIDRAIEFGRVVGCVVHINAATAEPGLTVHNMGRGLIVGEPRGGLGERVGALARPLAAAGFEVTVSQDIRRDIWYKLWGNMTVNPVSAMTGATGHRILADPLVMAFCHAAMGEAAAIGAKLGCPIAETPESRSKVTARLGDFRTSMLQDAEAGRPLELDALVGVVRELGARVGIATPNIDALFGLARLFGRVHGLYPA